ncbi:hypothetical protein MC7420_7344 [Coleofasciculus chthonoplastes PCC 7420]|uniref:Spore coat protein U domain-containing protein n=1 Tax=Coleofasciculus chthonoplastes PCC 7420 TaxID=118168 RepID=B4VHH3_9CYAN|nr:hypothetical protein [Coleofasciculus chthonoplastes]EDX78691.1 hypothetical protein MC7420_7344 [Coleofasciculus chthonoplastes PCC 7420]
MIRRLVLSGFVLAGAVAFSPNVLAQSVDVIFEGNIGEECSFATPVPGVLVYRGGPPTGPGSLIGEITSDAPGGVSGTVEVSCNTPGADIQISDARFVSFTPTNPEFDPPPGAIPPGSDAFLDARATVPGAETYYSGSAGGGGGSPGPSMPIFPLPPNPGDGLRQTVEVDLGVDNTGLFEAGIYQYAVTLTIVP